MPKYNFASILDLLSGLMSDTELDFNSPYIFGRYVECDGNSYTLCKPFFCYSHCLHVEPLNPTTFSEIELPKTIDNAYESEHGESMRQSDTAKGFVPDGDLYRIGSGIPISSRDINGYYVMTLENRMAELARIHQSILHMNPIMFTLYVKCKLAVLAIKQTKSMHDVFINIYELIIEQLKIMKENGIPTNCNSRHQFMIYALETCLNTFRFTKDVYGGTSALAYANTYNVHRRAFSGHIDYLSVYKPIGFVDPTFVSLAGQELWFVMHFLSPEIRQLHESTVLKTMYEGIYQVDLYDYTSGEMFVRDIYRFEQLIHQMFTTSTKLKGYTLVDILITISNNSNGSTDNDVVADRIAKILVDKLKVQSNNVPSIYFWIFDLINFPHD